MDERRDPAIKLFGKILIPLQGSGEDSIGAGEEENKLQRILRTSENVDPRKIRISRPAKPKAKEEERNPNGDVEETAVRRLDKIEACPRCDSLDTKFCYFNNYNVNQPRHFCKNCQRYWTAGGSLRNMPVGAGRRKSKSSPYYPRANLTPTHPTTTTTRDLSFGCESPLCESMASVLNLAGARDVFESCEENSSQSSMTGLSSTTDDGAGAASASAAAARKEAVNWECKGGVVAISPASASAFAFPLYPAVAYWGYTVPSSHPPHNNSPTLGKHSREGDKLDDTNSEKSSEEKFFWIPKMPRIDDPEEAAKSSIWATVGFRNENSGAACGDGLFKPFESKDGKKNTSEMPRVLQANPAAFARLMNFHESS